MKAYRAVIEARRSIGKWLEFYHDERPHQALHYRTPREIIEGEARVLVDNASASLRVALALSICTRVRRQEKEAIMY
jgi:Integrase core domain